MNLRLAIHIYIYIHEADFIVSHIRIFYLQRRICKHNLADNKYDIYERTVTYEGPLHNSICLPVKGGMLPTKIQEQCETMYKHIAQVIMLYMFKAINSQLIRLFNVLSY